MTWKWSNTCTAQGQVLADGLDVSHRHVRGHRADFRPAGAQASPERVQGRRALAFAHEDHGAADQVQHYGQVAMPFGDGNLVDGDLLELMELGLAVMLLEVAFLDLFDGVPTDPQVLGHVLDGHVLAQLQGVALEGPGMSPPRFGEGHVHLTGDLARLALHAGNGQEHGGRLVADGHAPEQARDSAVGDDVRRATQRAA
jgi:hypothetical protein